MEQEELGGASVGGEGVGSNVGNKINPETGKEYTLFEKLTSSVDYVPAQFLNYADDFAQQGLNYLDDIFTTVLPKGGVLSNLINKYGKKLMIDGENAPDFDSSKLVDQLLFLDEMLSEGTLTKENINKLNYDLESGEYLGKVYQELEDVKDKRLEGKGGYTGEGFINSSYEDKFIASVNAIVGVATTIVPAILTKGKSLGPQIILPMISSYNKEKAKHIYGDNDPKALEKLTMGKGLDFKTPAVLGYVAYQLEKLGFKSVSKYIFKESFKPSKFVKLLKTGNINGVQEGLQGLVEDLNTNLAQGQSYLEATKNVFTKEGAFEGFFENYLLGVVGGAGIAGTSAIANKAFKTDDRTAKKISGYVDNLSFFHEEKAKTKSKEELNYYDNKIKETNKEFQDYLVNNNKLSNYISSEQEQELKSILESNDKSNKKLQKLRKDLRENKISRESYNRISKDIIIGEAENRSRLSEIKNDANKILIEKDLDTARKAIKLIKGLNMKVFENPGEYLKELNRLRKKAGKSLYTEEDINNVDGNIIGNTILINKQTAAENNAISVGSHELLHGIVRSTINDVDGNITEDGVKLVKSLINELSTKQKNIIEKRLEAVYDLKRNKDGSIDDSNFDDYAEEYLTAYVDAAIKGDFDNNALVSFGNQVSSKIFKKNKFNGTFESGADVKAFLNEFVSDTRKGEVGSKFIKAANEGVGIKSDQMSKAASDNVQRVYEEKGAAGAFDIINEFKPIVSKIVEKRRDAPNFDRQLLMDEIETGKRGILDLISEYKPESGVPLAAFINKYLPSRAIEASKRILGEQFTQDVAEQKSVASKETAEDATNVEQRAKKELAEEKPSIRKKINIETNSKLYNKVKDAVIKTFGTKLPSISNKKFKAALQKAYRTELKKPIADFMGTRAKFESFLKDYGKEVYNKIDQSLINKRFKQFAEPVLDNDGKQKREKTPQGNAIFKKKKFNQGEWVSYFLSKGVGASTRGTRKDALAETIGEELGFDATMEVLKDPDVAARRKDILDLFEQEQVVNEIEIIAKEIDRNPKMQFSKTSKDYMSGIDFMNQAGSLIQEINNGNEVFGSKGEIKIKYESVDGLVDYDGDVVKLVYDAYHNVRIGTDKTVNILKKFSKELGDANVGTTYEYMVWQKIEDFAKNNKRIQNSSQTFAGPGEGKVYLAPIGSFKGGFVAAPDLILTIDKATVGETQISVELKASAARLGKNSPDFVSWSEGTFKREKRKLNRKGQAEKTGFTQKQLDKMESKVMKAINNVIKEAGPLLKALKEKMPGLTDITSTTKIPRLEVWDTVTGLGSVRALTNDSSVMVDGDFVANHYNSKGVYYIHILGKGTFYLGSDPLGIAKELGITKLEGDFPLKARINAVSDKNGNITMKITAEPELQLSYVTSKSDFDITSKEGLNKLLNTKKFLANKKIAEIIKPEIKEIENLNKSIKASRTVKNPKGITVLDFDDTLATSKSLIKYTQPDGTKGTLTPEQYASTYQDLQDLGYKFDFSEFNKVVDGKIAPLFQKALKLQSKFGPKNMFVLTARPAESAPAIFAFIKANGLNIPLENITGLANSTSEAKALWVAEKVGEGFNDFYFADDALQNVQAVKNMLDQFDVKSKVQQAKVKFSKSINEKFNDQLEEVTGIESKKRFAATKARKRGENKGKFRIFIPPSHEDFVGLLYNFMGKGKQGDAHRNFLEQALVKPLNRAYKEIDTAKQAVANDYKALNKQMPEVNKMLSKKTPDGDFTYQDAIRVYLWDKHGYTVPGLSPVDQKNLVDLVKADGMMQSYADTLNIISKQETYVDPGPSWENGNIRIDLVDATGRVGRAQYFTEFQENADIMFSEENLNKIEAAYGKPFREALEDMLHRIKTGINRPKGSSAKPNMFMNWLNASVAGVMFFNVRSALLQQMSNVNYLNFADNNIFAAGKAFANQKQYWKDFAMIFNSDMLKQRRGGLQTDINGAELAEAIKKARPGNLFDQVAIITGKALRLGFLPTQIGDNIAIATGGAAFYRNRVNKYIKDGLSQKEAETKAFTDFQDITQSTQQSARPDMTSKQQASWIGKLILNFLNTPSQYNRIIKKAALDIKNKRTTPPNTSLTQSNFSNASRILYYGAAQNLIFYSLQTALFAVMFGGDDEDEEKRAEQFLKKKERVINGSIDTILRGSGIYGVAISTLKNMAIKFLEQREKGYNKDESAVVLELANASPVVGIKLRRIVNAEKTLNYNKKVIKEMETFDIDNPVWSAVTNYMQAITTAPVNKIYQKTINLRNAADNDYSILQRLLFLSGYTTWSLNLGDTKKMQEIKAKTKNKNSKKKIKIRGSL